MQCIINIVRYAFMDKRSDIFYCYNNEMIYRYRLSEYSLVVLCNSIHLCKGFSAVVLPGPDDNCKCNKVYPFVPTNHATLHKPANRPHIKHKIPLIFRKLS